MNWLNLHVSVLDSPEFLGADPVQRATWLCLLRYCAGQENSGIIEDCREWTARQWQQRCNVTRTHIDQSFPLVSWAGKNIVVWQGKTIVEASAILSAKEKRKEGIDPAKNRRMQRMRRARQQGQHTTDQWLSLLARYQGACLCCGRTGSIQKDHVLPVSIGGSDSIDNLQPLCPPCNIRKGAKHIDYRKEAL